MLPETRKNALREKSKGWTEWPKRPIYFFFSSTLSRRVRHRGFCQQEEIASLRVSDLWKKSASDFGGENAVELVDEMQIINRL